MAGELGRGDFTDLMESINESVRSITRTQQEQARLTATGTAAGKRVTVVVNARGVVIQTKFAADIADLTYDEIAAAVTRATQDAAAQIDRRTRAMFDTLKAEQSRLPTLSEFLPGLPDIEKLASAPEVSTAPPSARVHEETDESADQAMEYTNVVQWDHQQQARLQSEVAESGW